MGNNQCCVMCGPNDISRAGNMGLTDTVGMGNNQCCVMCGPNDISRAGNMGLTDTVGSLHDERQGMD